MVAVAFGLLRHRLGLASDFRRAVALAASGFLCVVAVPFLIYPPNPPGVGDPASVGRRTRADVVRLGWTAVATASGWRLARQLGGSGVSEPSRMAAGVSFFVVLVVLAALMLPDRPRVDELPADLVWDFRISALLGGLAFWSVLGAVFGWRVSGALREREVAGV